MPELKLRPTKPAHPTNPVCPLRFILTASRKLTQEPHVVLEIKLQIVDVVFELRQALDAQAEGKTREPFRVVVHEAIDGRVDHARAEELNPARLLADVASLAAAEHARRVHLDRRLGEREIARPQAR